MNQVINVDVSITVYAFLNTTTQWDSGLYLIYGMTFQENPFEILAIMENKRNNFFFKKHTRCLEAIMTTIIQQNTELVWKYFEKDWVQIIWSIHSEVGTGY